MKGPLRARRADPRWPVVLTVLAVFLLLAALPDRVRLAQRGILFLLVLAELLPMAGVELSGASPRWVRIERRVTLLFCILVGSSTVATLGFVVRAMVRESVALSGMQLLSSGIAAWISNILVFSLLYWQLDRGGPEERANDAGARPDWLFPQVAASGNAPPDWRPLFIDYLAIGFTTATAFGPNDVLPLTHRAKVLIMLESSISLVTIVVVGARAINVLGH